MLMKQLYTKNEKKNKTIHSLPKKRHKQKTHFHEKMETKRIIDIGPIIFRVCYSFFYNNLVLI